jgi:hypothetical protein
MSAERSGQLSMAGQVHTARRQSTRAVRGVHGSTNQRTHSAFSPCLLRKANPPSKADKCTHDARMEERKCRRKQQKAEAARRRRPARRAIPRTHTPFRRYRFTRSCRIVSSSIHSLAVPSSGGRVRVQAVTAAAAAALSRYITRTHQTNNRSPSETG